MQSNLDSTNTAHGQCTDTAHFRRLRAMRDFTVSSRRSSAEPRARRVLRANFRKPGSPSVVNANPTPLTPAPFSARFQSLTHRPRTLGPGANREYRRAVRHAELAAWEAMLPTDQSALRSLAAAATQDTPGEKLAFRILVALAGMGIVWGLLNSLELVSHWPQFVEAIRQMIL